MSEAAFMSLAQQRRKRTRLNLHRRAPLGVHDAASLESCIATEVAPTVPPTAAPTGKFTCIAKMSCRSGFSRDKKSPTYGRAFLVLNIECGLHQNSAVLYKERYEDQRQNG